VNLSVRGCAPPPNWRSASATQFFLFAPSWRYDFHRYFPRKDECRFPYLQHIRVSLFPPVLSPLSFLNTSWGSLQRVRSYVGRRRKGCLYPSAQRVLSCRRRPNLLFLRREVFLTSTSLRPLSCFPPFGLRESFVRLNGAPPMFLKGT